MAFVAPNHAQETSTTTGTGTLTLDGPVSGFLAIGSQVSNGDTFLYSIWDDSGNIELGVGTYLTGPARLQRDTVFFSTNGGAKVDLPAGTRNVGSALAGESVKSLLDPSASLGFIARTAQNTYAARTLQGGDNGFITIENADGVSGNPKVKDDKVGPVVSTAGVADGSEIRMYEGNVANIPAGWHLCDGTQAPNGIQTPDLRKRFIVGYDPTDTDYDTIGNTGGEKTHKLGTGEVPSQQTAGSHSHGGTGPVPPGSIGEVFTDPGGAQFAGQHSHSISADGGHTHALNDDASPHENRPPYYVLAFIKWVGF